jgi:hypothetical protein
MRSRGLLSLLVSPFRWPHRHLPRRRPLLRQPLWRQRRPKHLRLSFLDSELRDGPGELKEHGCLPELPP